jgi:predicted protein tyrosine phosphatase
MDFIVSDRQSIEHGLVVMTPYIVISIRDPGTQKPRLRCGAGFQDALYLAFHDAEPSNDFELPSEIVLMTREDANQVWKFVQRWQDTIGTIVCHCEQGMSRSPAIAIGLCRGLGDDPSELEAEYSPNMFVNQLILDAVTG